MGQRKRNYCRFPGPHFVFSVRRYAASHCSPCCCSFDTRRLLSSGLPPMTGERILLKALRHTLTRWFCQKCNFDLNSQPSLAVENKNYRIVSWSPNGLLRYTKVPIVYTPRNEDDKCVCCCCSYSAPGKRYCPQSPQLLSRWTTIPNKSIGEELAKEVRRVTACLHQQRHRIMWRLLWTATDASAASSTEIH